MQYHRPVGSGSGRARRGKGAGSRAVFSREELLAVLEPFGEAQPLPRTAFVDPAVLAFEERFLFSSAWLPVAHRADLDRPGDWVRTPLRQENLVVLRGADLGISAMHAVCTHRGALLCDGEGGRISGLTLRCPYPGWTYATDGTLLEAPGAPRAAARPGLSRARVEVRAGVVFVNLDERAAPLDECGDPSPRLAAYCGVLRKYADVPATPIIRSAPKRAYGSIELRESIGLFDALDGLSRKHLRRQLAGLLIDLRSVK